MRRRLWIVALMLVLAAAASGAWFYAQSRGNTPKFRTAKVERGPLTATVSVSTVTPPYTSVNVINDTPCAHKFGAEIAADCSEISMYARPHV